MYSSPDTEIKCYTSSSPLYITANPITLYPSLYKGYTGTDKNGLILGKYSFNSEKSFKLEIGNFYTYNVYTNPAGKDILSIDIVLDQATRYSTDIVLKQRKY